MEGQNAYHIPSLSIVTTTYFSEKQISTFIHKMVSVAKELSTDFEIICVDDGSGDETISILKKIKCEYQQLKILELTRNFGHHPALLTGLSHAKHEYVFLIDSDLEEDPNWLDKFWKKMLENDCDSVFGIQKIRKKNIIIKILSRVFYWLAATNTRVNVQKDATTARLMTREFVDAILLFNDKVFAIGELWPSVGYNQVSVEVEKDYKGDTSYTFKKRLENAINFLISGSYTPILPLIFLVIFLTFLCLSMLAFVFFNFFQTGVLQGWTSTIAAITLFGTINILLLTLIILMLATILKEVKGRPIAIVKQIH